MTRVLAAMVVTLGCASSPSRQPSQAAVQTPTASPEPPQARTNALLPPLEIFGMDALLNIVARHLMDPASFDVTPASIYRNLRGGWVVDDDPFQINQFLHPYQGAMYHGIARSAGFGYWQSVAFTFAGSALWEIAGETTRPSLNDQIASGIAGSFLGEPLFRTSRLLLNRRPGRPGLWSLLTATVVSPPVGVNRMLFGDRYDPPTPEVLDASDIRFDVGVTAPLTANTLTRPFFGVLVDYGFPGTIGYAHARPFDYFRVDGTVSTDGLDNLSTRGLIAGKDYQAGDTVRGIWGVYGTYDYFAPDVFRISSTALAFGTTLQSSLWSPWSMSRALTFQNTALAGVGYTATQSVGNADGRDYHYGIAPQALVNTRVIAGRRAALDLTAREYFISGVGGFGTRPRDFIFRGDASLALRLYGRHAFAIKLVLSRRDATHPELPQLTQTRSSVGVFYSFLGAGGFGAIR